MFGYPCLNCWINSGRCITPPRQDHPSSGSGTALVGKGYEWVTEFSGWAGWRCTSQPELCITLAYIGGWLERRHYSTIVIWKHVWSLPERISDPFKIWERVLGLMRQRCRCFFSKFKALGLAQIRKCAHASRNTSHVARYFSSAGLGILDGAKYMEKNTEAV